MKTFLAWGVRTKQVLGEAFALVLAFPVGSDRVADTSPSGYLLEPGTVRRRVAVVLRGSGASLVRGGSWEPVIGSGSAREGSLGEHRSPFVRVAFVSPQLHRHVVHEARAAVRFWLGRQECTDLDAFDAGVCEVAGGLTVLADSGRSPDGVVTHRWRVRGATCGTPHLTVVVRTVEVGETWLLAECGDPVGTAADGATQVRRRAGDMAAFVRFLLERVEAYDGAARLTPLPHMVLGADGAADLVGVIRDARRRLPVVVLAEPLSVRRTAWEGAVVRLAYVAAGTVSMFVLMPQTLAALSRLTGVDVARACGDDAALVYLPTPGDGAGRAVPDGEIHLDDPTAVDVVPHHARDRWNEPHLFTPVGLRAWGSAAALPDHLLDIPSLLHSGSCGDANFDDIGLVRQLLREADHRARVAEQRLAALERGRAQT